MSTITEHAIEYKTLTREGQRTLRGGMVAALQAQFSSPTRSVFISVTSVDTYAVAGFHRDAAVWSGEEWDPEDNWLSDLITEAIEGQPVQSWSWTVTLPGEFTQVSIGFDAAGENEATGLVFGIPAHVGMPDEALAYFVAQCKVLWGSAWSPLP